MNLTYLNLISQLLIATWSHFLGGGGVFFALQPTGTTLINDKSTDLINFYQQLNNPQFKEELFLYADAWDELDILTNFLWQNCEQSFLKFMRRKIETDQLLTAVHKGIDIYFEDKSLWKDNDFVKDFSMFKTMLLASIVDKAKRIQTIATKEKRRFTNLELLTHFETGIRSGGYLFFRKLLNLHYQKRIQLSAAKAAANWYFVREFCYAAMFRFNAKGEFNIPYGGITYNKKKFRAKIGKIFAEEVSKLFSNATIRNEDFESFLANSKLKSDDFIFVDPPYDSEFSEYDQSSFTREDQRRLANFLIKTPAKWMVVIKETAFIRELYLHEDIKIKVFDKNYAYNMRGRNKRGVTHLIIMNY